MLRQANQQVKDTEVPHDTKIHPNLFSLPSVLEISQHT